MINIEIVLWSFIATIIRIIKDYIKERTIDIAKSFLIVLAGLSCAQLFTPYIMSTFSIGANMESSIAFTVGLSGKEIVEILLSLDFKSVFSNILSKKIESTTIEQTEDTNETLKTPKKRKVKTASTDTSRN